MYGLHLTVRRQPSHYPLRAKLRLFSIEQSRISASLEQLVKANWQQDSRLNSQFEDLRRNGLGTLEELRKIPGAYEQALQKDREFYKELLQEICELHNKILDENREYNDKTMTHKKEWDVALAKSLTELSSKLDHLADVVWKSTTEYHVLESLSDKGMTARYEKIADAHAQTFEWIFQDNARHAGSHSGHTFIEWLTHGTGIFWVTGKAGSGKSTLMKFLSHHRLTSETLTHWSGTKQLVIASFYFWYAGTEFQKSQDGLLRSLLYEIFRQCPELMQIILPQHWDPQSPARIASHITWTRSELNAAFNRLAQHPESKSVFCFFIDGLDEFDGDHSEIIALIQGFAKSENIKWCLSSRPWNVFKAAFGNGSHPSLQLESLTKEDIILYVRDELEENEAFRNLKRQEGIACATLVDEIVDKAEGVFLWVFLVVRSLISGLQNADRIMDLQRRLRRFPSDLEGYFQHILNNIDDNYKQQTAQTFFLALQASEPLSLMTYAMVDELEVNPSYALDLGIHQISSAEITSKHSDMKLRINARCKDLLEVTPVGQKPRASLDRGGLAHDSYTSSPSFYEYNEYKVDFLHRTVRDFLHLREIYERILGNVSGDFNVDQSLCAAILAQVKTVSLQKVDSKKDGQLPPLVDGMMYHARQIESRTNISPFELLESFYDVVIRQYWALGGPLSTSLQLLCNSPIAFSVHRDLQLYVENKMANRQGDLSLYRDEGQLFSHAMDPHKSFDSCPNYEYNYNMLRLLISKGGNPNRVRIEPKFKGMVCGEVYGSWLEKARSLELPDAPTTFERGPRELQWVMYVLKALRLWVRDKHPFKSILSETVETFLRRGVNPNWVYGKHSLWTYFTVCLYSDCSYRRRYSRDSQNCALRIVKAFYRRGASRSQIIMHEANNYIDPDYIQSIPDAQSIQYEKTGDNQRVLSAHAAIKRVISAKGMQGLEFGRKKKISRLSVGKHGTDMS